MPKQFQLIVTDGETGEEESAVVTRSGEVLRLMARLKEGDALTVHRIQDTPQGEYPPLGAVQPRIRLIGDPEKMKTQRELGQERGW